MNAIESFRDTVKTHQLFTAEDTLLLAVSGGSDSIALCHICKHLGYAFGIAHVNFQLRGEDSELDATFVENLANSLSVSFHGTTEDCQKIADEKNWSIQEAARNIRYEFFEQIRKSSNYDYIVTAHHAADNLETMLYTLVKGAHLSALRGIPIKRERILRPLLYTLKSDIDQFINDHKLAYRVDKSNSSLKYQRNFIRHEIIPKIKQINPGIESTLIDTSLVGAQLQDWIGSLVENDKKRLNQDGALNLKLMQGLSYRLAWLYEIIGPLGFNLSDCKDIWTAFSNDHATGKLFHGKKADLMIDRNRLILQKARVNEVDTLKVIASILSCSVDSDGLLKMIPGIEMAKDPTIANIDIARITFPVILRSWNDTDVFYPLGMKGKRKTVKSFLKDAHIPKDIRNQILVLESKGDIIWVAGLRIDERFKVTKATDEILQISLA